MPTRVHLATVGLLTTWFAGLSCSSSNGSVPGADAGPERDAAADDGGVDASGGGDAAPTQAMVRFAQLASDAPPLDVCLAPRGTGNYLGPLLEHLAEDAGLPAGAAAAGLSFADVSAYFAVDAGAYDVRLVPAGATSCAMDAVGPPSMDAGRDDAEAERDADVGAGAEASAEAGDGAEAGADASLDAGTGAVDDAGSGVEGSLDAGTPSRVTSPLPADTTTLPPFVAGTFTTVLVAGELAPARSDAPFRMTAVVDDTVLAGGEASLRAINALPAVPTADFGFGSSAGGGWSPLFRDVAFGGPGLTAAPSQGKADSNGYLPIAPFGPGPFSVRTSGDAGGDVASSQAAVVAPGAVVTVLAAGGGAGDAAHPPVLVLCVDSASSGGPLSVCSVLP
jgi:hypothetical protein